MAKKTTTKKATPPDPPERSAVTEDRAVRLYRLVVMLGERAQTRPVILRKLGLNVRDFYRALDTLRDAGIEVQFQEGSYHLTLPLDRAVKLLPMFDPKLTVGEAESLAKGRTAAHRHLKEVLKRFQAPPPKKRTRRAT